MQPSTLVVMCGGTPLVGEPTRKPSSLQKPFVLQHSSIFPVNIESPPSKMNKNTVVPT